MVNNPNIALFIQITQQAKVLIESLVISLDGMKVLALC